MNQVPDDMAATLFVLPADAKFLPVSELSARLQAKIGPVIDGQSVITRPGFRVTTQLVPGPLAALVGEFHQPSLLTNAVLRFSREHGQDPMAMLELSFDALATLIEARILVPEDSADAHAPEPSLAAGQAFAGFEIEELVRSLEDSEVYRVRVTSGDSAALKIARDGRESVAKALANEARILDLLSGEDTPQLLDHGVEHGRAFVAMEWCDGDSITATAQRARAACDRRLLHRIVTNMLEAYGRLHASGVLHGDVHPGNCLVRDDGRVVILDFGSARLANVEADTLDLARAGIPHFYDPLMASALLAGRIPPAATLASEQYAICVLAYLLLTGLHPIETPAVKDELLRNIVDRLPLPFAARAVPAWPAVEAVIGRGLEKRPSKRFPDVASLARAFAASGQESEQPGCWPNKLQRELDRVIDDTRNLRPSAEQPLYRAWFALRTALAMNDVELLAAADVLVGRARHGWAAETVAAKIARARSDYITERQVIERFLATVEPLADGPEALSAILAAAEILDETPVHKAGTASLAAWASQRLERLMSSLFSTGSTTTRITEAQLAYAALSLCKTGAIEVPVKLPVILETLRRARDGGVWFWALAHDVFADQPFKALALAAERPRDPVAHGFALLRLHQLTGEMSWIAGARRLVSMQSARRISESHIALLMIDLIAPERAVFPAFLPMANSVSVSPQFDGNWGEFFSVCVM